MQQNKEMILASNRSLAEQNLILQPRLDHQKNELTKNYRCLQEQFEAFQLRKSMLGNVTNVHFLFSAAWCPCWFTHPQCQCLSLHCLVMPFIRVFPSLTVSVLSLVSSLNKPPMNKAHHQKLVTGFQSSRRANF